MLTFLNKKLETLGLKNINLIEKRYIPQTWKEMEQSYKEYHRVRAAFLKMLSYSHKEECQEIGLANADIELLKKGISPENYNTHLKVPFDFGGALDFNNLSIVKSHPIHDRLHQIIEFQISTDFLKTHKKIYIPSFEGKIYHD
jgi:hypothetical protein